MGMPSPSPLSSLVIRWIVIYPVDSAIQRWIKWIVTKKPEKPTDLPKIQYGRRLVDSAWTAQVSHMLLMSIFAFMALVGQYQKVCHY